MKRILLSSLAAMAMLSPGAYAQEPVRTISREVVQPLPPEGLDSLQSALQRLARNPRDVDALVSAGNASLRVGDNSAAEGFFLRALEFSPNNGLAKAGLGAATVRQENPFLALALFSEAERLGADPLALAGDKGLAHDLVGDNVTAQAQYRRALTEGDDPEITRRLALSQAITGDRAGSEQTLLPLLQQRDMAAYRARAFALAILGETEEAMSIAEAIMPQAMARRMEPYFRHMPKLSPAQQAAAGNLGHFPAAAEIAVSGSRIARSGAPVTEPGSAEDPARRLVPAGEPMGEVASASTGADIEVTETVETAVVTSPPPVVQTRSDSDTTDLTPIETVEVGASSAQASQAVEVAVESAIETAGQPTDIAAPAGVAVEGPSFTIASDPTAGQPETFDLARVGQTTVSPPVAGNPEPQQSVIEDAPEEPASVASAFADFLDTGAMAGPVSGAVDITRIEVSRDAAPEAEPAPPAHPSRIWVQVATGRDRDALRFDWRRIARSADGALDGQEGHVAAWGETNRLVTGPFDSRSAANTMINQLKEAGIDSFRFTSSDGEEVAALP